MRQMKPVHFPNSRYCYIYNLYFILFQVCLH